MNGRNDENLKELFERFLDVERAKQAVEDVRKGEQILHEHPAPEPDVEFIAEVKAEITQALMRRKAGAFKRMAYKAAVGAAAVIILAAIGVKLFETGGSEPQRFVAASIIPKAIWESERLASDDADLAILIAEIEQIERDLLAVRLGENGSNGSRDIAELETEFIEISSDFWKG